MNAAQFNEYIRQLKARNESELTVKRAEVYKYEMTYN